MYPEVHFPREASLRWSGVEPPRHSNARLCSPYSPRALAQCKMPRFHYEVVLKALTKPLHQAWGTSPQLNWRLPRITTKPLIRLGFKEPKSKKLLNFHSPNPHGELKPMQPMQWQEHKCSSASLPNSTKATKAMGE